MGTNESAAFAGTVRARGGIRIFVVDDHPVFRKGLIDVLNDEPGLSVVGEAGTVGEALSALAAGLPDVTIVDLSLGGDTGLDVVKYLTDSHPQVRVLVVSGLDERVHADRALKAGALGYIMKDKPAAEIVDAVRRVAAGRPYVSAETADRILTTLGGPNPRRARTPLENLSAREQQVLSLMGSGLSTRDIASRLSLSTKTVESYYAHIKQKLGLRNGRELMRVAVTWSIDHPQ